MPAAHPLALDEMNPLFLPASESRLKRLRASLQEPGAISPLLAEQERKPLAR